MAVGRPAALEMSPKLCSGREALHAVGTPDWAAGREVGGLVGAGRGVVVGALREGRVEFSNVAKVAERKCFRAFECEP